MSYSSFFLLVKFSLAGMAGVLTNFGITFIAKEKLGWNKYTSNILGFSFSIGLNYVLNRTWTFHSEASFGCEFIKYLSVVLIGLALNHIIVFMTHDKLKVNFYVAKVIAVGIVFVWNFSMHTLFTF